MFGGAKKCPKMNSEAEKARTKAARADVRGSNNANLAVSSLLNRENNREIFRFGLKIVEFCPKFANFLPRQGINREFSRYPAKPLKTE